MEISCWWKLPVDIQADILSRLRGQTLISLKLVSWGWYDVISNICMPKLAPPSPKCCFLGFIFRDCQNEGVGPPSRLKLAVVMMRSNFNIHYNAIRKRLIQYCQPDDVQDCCNGILLVVQHDNNGDIHYRIYNPTTGETILVPQPPHSYHSHHSKTTQCCFASLVFEPTKSLHYKIFCTPGGSITNPLKVETFSSEIGKWLGYVVDIDSKLDGVEWIYRSAYLDGRLYRLSKSNYLACIDEGKSSELLSVQAIELPNFSGDTIYIDENNYYGSIGISLKHLHYSTRDGNGSTLLVYMLKDDVSWLLKYTIPIDDLLPEPSDFFARGIKRIVNMYRKEAWFNFYAFHPNCDGLFIITPLYMLFYCPKEKFLELCHMKSRVRATVVGQNYSFLYSHCPIILRSAFQRISCGNLYPNLSFC